MINQDLKKGGHVWEKVNVITIVSKRKGSFDMFKCQCGLKGKSFQLGMISIDGRKKSLADNCPLAEKNNNKGVKIRITKCSASGGAFANLKPNSEHLLIDTPKGRSQDEYWVNGVGEPVRLLEGEFIFI